MTTLAPDFLPVQLAALRAELVDLAFALDQRRQPAAADVAMMVAARLEELVPEPGETGSGPTSGLTRAVC